MFVPDRPLNPFASNLPPAGVPWPINLGGANLRLEFPASAPVADPNQSLLQMQMQSTAMLMQMMQILMTLMHNQQASSTGTSGQQVDASQQVSPVDSSQQSAPVGGVTDATSGPVQGSELGKRIAQRAESNAKAVNTPGWCLREVGKVLREFGLPIDRHPSAYMALNDFRKSDRFQEIKVSKDQLKSLPAGAVVIWDKGPGLPHGHISIALGDGREASSTVRNQLNLSTQFWVFLPR